MTPNTDLPAGSWPYPPYGAQPTTWVPSPPPTPFVDDIPDRTAARAVIASIAAGLLAQLLFVAQPAGINFPIWVAVVIAAAFALRRSDARLDRADLWLPITALVFATFLALRDDVGLFLFDVLAAGSLTLAATVAIGGQPVSRRAGSSIVRLGAGAMAVALGGAVRVAAGLAPLVAAIPTGRHDTFARVLRGLLIAVPLVIGFAWLFSSADAVFQAFLQRVFDIRIDGNEFAGRLIFASFAAWLFAGTMAAAWLSRDRFGWPKPTAEAAPAMAGGLGTLETLIVLVAVDLVFALFVIFQVAYLFPGHDPLTVSGMTFAQYARRGFFELVIVAVLSGLLLIWLDSAVKSRTRTYLASAISLAALSGVVLVSATVRMVLYQQAYGWTELRFYTLAAIALLALGLVAAVLTLVTNRVSALPKFMVGAGFAVAIVCNVIGPQAFVTARNVERAIDPSQIPADGHTGLDTTYLELLGADSVPILIDSIARLPDGTENAIHVLLTSQARSLREESAGWPAWNLSRQYALDVLTASGY